MMTEETKVELLKIAAQMTQAIMNDKTNIHSDTLYKAKASSNSDKLISEYEILFNHVYRHLKALMIAAV
jgi:hypothetical protein